LITAIIFSRDRPAQLELLLDSMEKFNWFERTVVIYRATDTAFGWGYEKVRDEREGVIWLPERNFQDDTNSVLENADLYTCFLTDDDYFYQHHGYHPLPWNALKSDPELLTVSLRLCENTTYCYPMRQSQKPPARFVKNEDLILYGWKEAEYDFGYPASLDGNVFRTNDLKRMIGDREFQNPNTLEDVLVKRCDSLGLPLMAYYEESCLVNLPVNRVNTTHRNRFGDTAQHDPVEINKMFLDGWTISPEKMDFKNIDAAHVERKLVFVQ
jgi:hypothetical protein